MHNGTDIFAQQGIISISEKRNHMGQGLGEYGGRGGGGGECGDEAKQLLFLSLKSPQLLWRYERGHSHVEDGHV